MGPLTHSENLSYHLFYFLQLVFIFNQEELLFDFLISKPHIFYFHLDLDSYSLSVIQLTHPSHFSSVF